MSLSTPRRPWRLAVAGVVGWVVLTLLSALVQGDTALHETARDGLRAAAAAFATLALGGGLLELWQRREWRRRTQWVAFDLIDRSMRRLANVAAGGFDVVTASAPVLLSQVYCLPWTVVRERAVKECAEVVSTALVTQALAEWGEGNPPDNVRHHADDVATLGHLQDRADDLWSVVQELSAYLDDQLGPELLTAAGELHSAVRGVVEPAPGDVVPESLVLPLVATQLGKVIAGTEPVARCLDRAYAEALRHVTDEKLRERLEQEEHHCSKGEKGLKALLDAWVEEARQHRELDRASTSFTETGADLIGTLREVIDAPDADAETVRLVREALEEVERVTDELLKQLRDPGQD
ncbi:hypothetical protein [Georgenia sp. AZ-5]|uniref:hypothetical protein n=1 Tax=Georgenia sp. AZ-5 TaxID=3367526 RepID=UPI0037551509